MMNNEFIATEKQEKHLKSINKKTCDKTNLVEAKKAKNDEFYTGLSDILNELNHYADKIVGKKILCPCDWDIVDPSTVLGNYIGTDAYKSTCRYESIEKEDIFSPTAKLSYAAIFDENNNQLARIQSERTIQSSIKENNSDCIITEAYYIGHMCCNFANAIHQIVMRTEVVPGTTTEVTRCGYNPETKKGFDFHDTLKHENLKDYDMVITNPPFSLYKEFLKMLIEERDKRINTSRPFNFILLAPFVNRGNPVNAVPLMERKIYLGYGRDIGLKFEVSRKENQYKGKSVICDWITTFDDAQKEIDKRGSIHTGVSYELYKNDFEFMPNMTMKDGTHPLRVKSKRAIPEDYKGWMMTSVTLLDIMSYDEYEWHICACAKYFNTEHPDRNPFTHTVNATTMFDMADGSRAFTGMIFRKKPAAISSF